MMTIEELVDRFDDAVSTLERIATAVEALVVLQRSALDVHAKPDLDPGGRDSFE